MRGGIISNNTAVGRGGGVQVHSANTRFTMNNAAARIENNTSNSDGGGIFHGDGIIQQ